MKTKWLVVVAQFLVKYGPTIAEAIADAHAAKQQAGK